MPRETKNVQAGRRKGKQDVNQKCSIQFPEQPGLVQGVPPDSSGVGTKSLRSLPTHSTICTNRLLAHPALSLLVWVFFQIEIPHLTKMNMQPQNHLWVHSIDVHQAFRALGHPTSTILKQDPWLANCFWVSSLHRGQDSLGLELKVTIIYAKEDMVRAEEVRASVQTQISGTEHKSTSWQLAKLRGTRWASNRQLVTTLLLLTVPGCNVLPLSAIIIELLQSDAC